jgi:hypothetical protein
MHLHANTLIATKTMGTDHLQFSQNSSANQAQPFKADGAILLSPGPANSTGLNQRPIKSWPTSK